MSNEDTILSWEKGTVWLCSRVISKVKFLQDFFNMDYIKNAANLIFRDHGISNFRWQIKGRYWHLLWNILWWFEYFCLSPVPQYLHGFVSWNLCKDNVPVIVPRLLISRYVSCCSRKTTGFRFDCPKLKTCTCCSFPRQPLLRNGMTRDTSAKGNKYKYIRIPKFRYWIRM